MAAHNEPLPPRPGRDELTDFWDRGYNFGLRIAVTQLRNEAEWQRELEAKSRGLNAKAVVARFNVLADLLDGLTKLGCGDVGVNVGGRRSKPDA